MKNVQTFQIDNPLLWEPYGNGVFVTLQDTTFFYYKYINSVCEVNCSRGSQQVIFHCPPNHRLPLPSNWLFCKEKNVPVLILSADLCLNLLTHEITKVISLDNYNKYIQHKEYYPEKEFETRPFRFGKYEISKSGNWGYSCRYGGEQIWTFKGKAYLATDIFLFQDHLFWGTSGAGGFFYLVELKTGELLLSIPTGSTKGFIIDEDRCYIGVQGKKASNVLCISLSKGSVLQSYPIEGLFSDYSKLHKHENNLFVTSFIRQKNQQGKIIVSMIEV